MNNPETYHNQLSRRRAIGLLGLGMGAIQFPMGCTKDKSMKDSVKSESIHYMTLSKISKMIRKKEISSAELTQIILNRITTVDKKLNSYLTTFNEAALATASKLDEELESGKYRGPLHGVPIAVKDLLYTTNAPTTGGHAFKTDFVPSYNATVVNKLDEAGAVILGKTNLTEGAMAGYHPHFKIPVNPWGPYHPGESSSGSGVATAAGLCFGRFSQLDPARGRRDFHHRSHPAKEPRQLGRPAEMVGAHYQCGRDNDCHSGHRRAVHPFCFVQGRT